MTAECCGMNVILEFVLLGNNMCFFLISVSWSVVCNFDYLWIDDNALVFLLLVAKKDVSMVECSEQFETVLDA